MTNNQPDRLDRIEALLERSIAASDERLTRIELLTDSNSRSIQALTDDVVEFRLTVAEDRGRTEALINRLADVQEGIANLLASLDSDRPTILRKLNTIENKVDRLLEQEGGQQE